MKDVLARSFAALMPAEYCRYLRRQGWKELPSSSEKSQRLGIRYRDLDVDVEIPLRQSFADYPKRVLEAAEIIAQVQELSLEELLTALQHPSVDVLRFRYTGEDTQDGAISLDDSIRMRQARKDLLLSVAHSVVEPLPRFARLSRHEPVEFVRACRELPSRRGSYVSEVLVPVSPAIGQQADLLDPFARRATSLLTRALAKTNDAISRGDDSLLLNAAQDGVSANFLSALARLSPPNGRGELHLTVNWASMRPKAEPAYSLAFAASAFLPVEEAARVLRETSEVQGYELCGYIAKLERSADDASQPGAIQLATTLDDTPGVAKVQVVLAPAQYQLAIEAHQHAQQVRITGRLRRVNRRYRLENPGELVVTQAVEESD